MVERIGIAVIWFNKKWDKWYKKRCFFSKHKDLFDAEFWAILDIWNLGNKKTKNAKPITKIFFIDSQTALIKILELKTKVGKDVIRNIID